MPKFYVHADFNCGFEEQIDAPSQVEALNKLIHKVYLKGMNPLIDLAHFAVTDEYGNVVERYLYDRPRIGKAVLTEDGRTIYFGQPNFFSNTDEEQ